jgi:hypothetical protein
VFRIPVAPFSSFLEMGKWSHVLAVHEMQRSSWQSPRTALLINLAVPPFCNEPMPTRGSAVTRRDGADLEAFAKVSEARVGRNQPAHVAVTGDASTTSLAAALLKKGSNVSN